MTRLGEKVWYLTRVKPRVQEVGRQEMAPRLSFGVQGSGRYELDDRGLRLYNAAGELTAEFDVDGVATVILAIAQALQLYPQQGGIDDSAQFYNNSSALVARVTEDADFITNGTFMYDAAPATTEQWGAVILGSAGIFFGPGGDTPAEILIERVASGILGIRGRGAGDHVAVEMREVASAPSAGASGRLRLYVKDKAGTSALYYKNDAGVEREVAGMADIPATPPVNSFLGRALVQAGTWSNAPTDGWEDWGGGTPLSVTVTKAAAGTKLLVDYGFSVFRSTAGGAMNYAIHESVSNTRYDTLQAFINTANEHLSFTGSALISGLSAASHTLKLQIDNITAGGNVETDNANDFGHIKVWEVP